MNPINYISQQDDDYVRAIEGAETLDALMAVLRAYSSICADALRDAPQNEAEFSAWRNGLRRERKGKYAGDEFARRFGTVMIPGLLMRVTMTSRQFMVPWGCAFLKCLEAGHIIQQTNGEMKWVS